MMHTKEMVDAVIAGMNDGQNISDQPVKNHLRTLIIFENFATGQGDDYVTGCLLDYPFIQIIL